MRFYNVKHHVVNNIKKKKTERVNHNHYMVNWEQCMELRDFQ